MTLAREAALGQGGGAGEEGHHKPANEKPDDQQREHRRRGEADKAERGEEGFA